MFYHLFHTISKYKLITIPVIVILIIKLFIAFNMSPSFIVQWKIYIVVPAMYFPIKLASFIRIDPLQAKVS